MASEVDIYNMALSHIGSTVTVADKLERSPERVICSRFYETCRDALLSYKSCDWRFAETSALLADLGTPPTNWLYRYAMPNDCIRPMFIVVPGLLNPRADQMVVYQVAHAETGRVVLTNYPAAELRYIKRLEEAERFPSYFVEAMALRLASLIAMPIAKSSSLRDELVQRAEQAAQIAMAATMNEAQPVQEPRSSYESAIHGFSVYGVEIDL